MEVIDTHVHIWPVSTTPPQVAVPYHGPADAAHLIGEMDRAGVAGSILITPRALGTDNSFALAAVRAHPGRYLGVVGVVDHHHPAAEARRLQQEAAAGALHGVRFHPCFDPDLDLAAPHLAPLWDACTAAALPVCVHADPAQYRQVRALAGDHPGLVILIDHMGRLPLELGPDSPAFRHLLSLARYPGVYLKISSVPWLLRGSPSPDALDSFVTASLAAFGPDRLLWGGDWPVLEGVGWSYSDTVAHALRLPLGEQERSLYLSGNARRVYRLP